MFTASTRLGLPLRPVVTVGVDVGGTNIQVGLVVDDHSVVGRAKRPTPRTGPASVIEAILEAVAEANEDDVGFGAVGVGIPGAVHGGEVVQVPNLGEWVAGAARGHDDVLGVWLERGDRWWVDPARSPV